MTWTIIFKHNATLLSKVFIGPHDSIMARKHAMNTFRETTPEFIALIRGDHDPIFQTEAERI